MNAYSFWSLDFPFWKMGPITVFQAINEMIQNTSALHLFNDCTHISSPCFTEEETGRDKPSDLSTVSQPGRERDPELAPLDRAMAGGGTLNTSPLSSFLRPAGAAQATQNDSDMGPADRVQE